MAFLHCLEQSLDFGIQVFADVEGFFWLFGFCVLGKGPVLFFFLFVDLLQLFLWYDAGSDCSQNVNEVLILGVGC